MTITKNSSRIMLAALLLAVAIVFVLLPQQARAATITISDQASCENFGGRWSDPDDRECELYRSVTIDAGDTLRITNYVNVVFDDLTINGELIGDRIAAIYLDSSVTNNGTIVVQRRLRFYGTTFINNGTINISPGSFDFSVRRGVLQNNGVINVRSLLYNTQVIRNDGDIFSYPGGTTTGTGTYEVNPIIVVNNAIVPNVSGPMGANGWYTGDVTVSWTLNNPLSAQSGCDPTTISDDTGGTILTCTASGVVGTASRRVTIKRDASAPVATATVSASAAPNAAGWYNTDVTVTFSGDDGTGSGVDFCDADVILTGDGYAQSASGSCTDLAGNSSTQDTASGINIDKTAPVVTVTGVVDGETYILGSVPVAGCDTQDTLSLVATPASLTLSGGDANGLGAITATCAGATDNAGNSGSVSSVIYTVISPSEAAEDLVEQVGELNLQQGIDNSLDAKLATVSQALDDLNDNNDVAASNALQAFINAVEAQRGEKINDTDADALIASAQAIIAVFNAD